MKKAVKKQISIADVANLVESLAISTAKSFSSIDERFTKIDERFNKIDGKLVSLEENIKSTRREILNIGDNFVKRSEFDNLLIRFNKLEKKIKEKSS